MAEIDLRIDGYGVCPGFPFDETGHWRAVGDVDAPVVHTRHLGGRKTRTFELTWPETTLGQVWILERAFASAGKHLAMNFLPPDGGGIVEVIFTGALETTQQSATTYEARAELEESIR